MRNVIQRWKTVSVSEEKNGIPFRKGTVLPISSHDDGHDDDDHDDDDGNDDGDDDDNKGNDNDDNDNDYDGDDDDELEEMWKYDGAETSLQATLVVYTALFQDYWSRFVPSKPYGPTSKIFFK